MGQELVVRRAMRVVAGGAGEARTGAGVPRRFLVGVRVRCGGVVALTAQRRLLVGQQAWLAAPMGHVTGGAFETVGAGGVSSGISGDAAMAGAADCASRGRGGVGLNSNGNLIVGSDDRMGGTTEATSVLASGCGDTALDAPERQTRNHGSTMATAAISVAAARSM